ncbi:radical SAM protein [candidate division WOR-3 bacterium]|uniref:Radical SAM protein n=1 Tax=candidate division WOR-3 bacterium TaxID=2052148 RepID=A0A9D5K8C9_UNCW3|nr:radical SAM protein [candidate division WOR-3 bacterium]MBD3364025.1 radical SAM protein [candidate division WOR-3 bacterium]
MKKTAPRILITTAYRHSPRDFYDAVGANFYRTPRFAFMRTVSTSLRFLKQNLPEIEIMEFPRWNEYVKKLAEGWDVVGFTFFQHDLAEVLEMVTQARKQGVKEIWAGGYGGLSEEAEEFADRIWYGYVEEKMSAEIFGRRLDRIVHPPIVIPVNIVWPPMLPYKKVGLLFTQRGCPFRCTFCQTPVHSPRPSRLPLESIEEVLAYYRKTGINELFILDETFYTFPSHSEKVLDLLAKYKFHWWVQSRADLTLEHIRSWTERGMVNVGFGVESVNDEILKKIGKRTNLDVMRAFREATRKHRIFTMAFYMIGYEEDTVESVLRDYKVLYDIGFDAHQLTVLTPYPKTPQWFEFKDRYGIFEKDYHKHDARFLIWNHPNITPAQMQFLSRVGMGYLNVPMRNYGAGIIRMVQKRIYQKGFKFLWDDLARPFLHSLAFNERRQILL